MKHPRLLVISQVYVPDTPAVGQYMHEAAAALASRGVCVRVLTSAQGYEDPTKRFRSRETRDGVDIIRLPFSSFGKKSVKHRLAGQLLFLFQVCLRGLFTPGLTGIMVSTSPPMASAAALFIRFFRRVPIKFWVMDLNPDQLIEMGRLKESALPAKLFDMLNRAILRASDDVIALDRFMADRLLKKANLPDKISILPPWPQTDPMEMVDHADNHFRHEHGLDGKFVVMYSGNHGQTTPVTTLLDAAVRMQDRKDLVFIFIGGGIGKQDVEQTITEHHPTNVINLPYQPFDQLRYSLSAADVHAVTMLEAMKGVIHPCKVYGALALARPILLVGPAECHVGDILQDENIGWQVEQGDVEGTIALLDQILALSRQELQDMGNRAAEIVREEYQKDEMVNRFCQIIVHDLPIKGT